MSGVLNTLLAVPLAERFVRHNRSLAEWRHAQTCHARRLVKNALAGSDFYRSLWEESGVQPDPDIELDDLARLPVIDRATWRSVPLEKIMTTHPAEVPISHQTGGTSGNPFLMPYFSIDDIRLRATVLAVMRGRGVRWYERALWFLPPDTHSRGGHRLFGRVRMIDSDATTEARLDALREGTEQIVRGYPWPVWRAVVLARRRGVTLPPRRLFVTGGEPLPASVRRTIEQALGARVVNRYAATDYGQMAAECEKGSLHLCAGAHVRILTESGPAKPGQEGEVVATNFFSSARPLIQVRTGDYAAWSETRCSCGNEIPHLACVSGRTGDAILTPAGEVLRFVELERALTGMEENLLGFQFEQQARDRVLVRLCLGIGPGNVDDVRSRLEARLPGMRVSVELTDQIATEPNGKTRACRGMPPKSP
ncbi:MAG: hypothetical protein KJ626_07795 [Verrucomicrobia bacterium]|nr:hypothetical protein [Verrucomicrobiota bacterium]